MTKKHANSRKPYAFSRSNMTERRIGVKIIMARSRLGVMDFFLAYQYISLAIEFTFRYELRFIINLLI